MSCWFDSRKEPSTHETPKSPEEHFDEAIAVLDDIEAAYYREANRLQGRTE